MTKNEAKKRIKDAGMRGTYNTDAEEWRVAYPNNDEDTAYYTDDMEDAVATAEYMAAEGRRANPEPQDSLVKLLNAMRASFQVYRDAHWTVKGNDYYGNHLLLQRIYEETQLQIDRLAEQMVGSYGSEIIREEPNRTTHWVERFTTSDPMQSSLNAAREVRGLISDAYEDMDQGGQLGHGWDDLLMALAQEKDTHLYLLQQATNTAAPLESSRAANPDVRKLKTKLLR